MTLLIRICFVACMAAGLCLAPALAEANMTKKPPVPAEDEVVAISKVVKQRMDTKSKMLELEIAAAKKKFGPDSPEVRAAEKRKSDFDAQAALALIEIEKAEKAYDADKADAKSKQGEIDKYIQKSNELKKIYPGRDSKEYKAAVAQLKDSEQFKAMDPREQEGAVARLDESFPPPQYREELKKFSRDFKHFPEGDGIFFWNDDYVAENFQANLEKAGKLMPDNISIPQWTITQVPAGRKCFGAYCFETYKDVGSYEFKAEDGDELERELKEKYEVIDVDRAAGRLSADAVDMIFREQADGNKRDQAEREAILESLYAGEFYIDRLNERVKLSSVVLRPSAASINTVRFSDRMNGDHLGLSIVSHYIQFNKALPKDWGIIVAQELNSAANLAGGSPDYYRLVDQVSFRSPQACQLCITQTLEAPVLHASTWRQAYSEHYNVQGQDKGFVRYSSVGTLLAGSDDISILTAHNGDALSFTYRNNSLGEDIFSASIYFVSQRDKSFAGGAVDLSGLANLRAFTSTPDPEDRLVEIRISAPSFNGKEIDVLLKSVDFLSLF